MIFGPLAVDFINDPVASTVTAQDALSIPNNCRVSYDSATGRGGIVCGDNPPGGTVPGVIGGSGIPWMLVFIGIAAYLVLR